MRKPGSARLPPRPLRDALVGAAALLIAAGAEGPLGPYAIVGDAIPASLTGATGDPARGRAIMLDRRLGACLLCHTGPFPEERFQGTLAPDLSGTGSRWSAGQIRLRLGRRDPPKSRDDHAALLPDRRPRPCWQRLANRS